ncbi:hypothetical protein OMY_00507, partial [Enterococcus sulfureus ATCC 49903]
MSKKNNLNKLLHSNKKEHYRMYKSGKHWVYAMITTYGGMLGLTAYTNTANAEETNTTLDTSREVEDKDILATQETATIPSNQVLSSESTTNTTDTSTTDTSTSSTEVIKNTSSESTSTTTSTTTSLDSEQASLSQSTSLSTSTSTSNLTSLSLSESLSGSMSLSGSLSTSNKISESYSSSLSSSLSSSTSLSQSKQTQSESVSNSTSQSISTSQSASKSVVTDQSMTSQSDVQATSQAQNLFDQLGSEKVDVTVDSKTSELTIVTQDYKAPSSALIRATQQYAAVNNLVAYFALRDAAGKTTKVKVSSDPDANRAEFEDILNNGGTAKTPTSVTVTVSDQITNKEIYKQTAKENNTYAAVSDWASLKTAYSNQSITYIEVTGDFSAASNVATRDLGWRQTSVIIDGNGHTVNMQNAAFNVGTTSTTKGSIFTITNLNLIHYQTGTNSGDSGTGSADAVIDSRNQTGGYGYWNYNIDNITLKGIGDTANENGRRLLDAEDSQVTLSGVVTANVKQELMQIGQVDIANGAKVTLNRTQGTTGYSMFYYMAIRGNQTTDTGYAHTFTVGDNATISGNELSSYNSNNYPLVYYGFNGILVGDNVNWSQDGFQMLLDMGRYSGSNLSGREVTFGQNLNMVATRTVGSNSLNAANSSTITFNAGTVLDLQQWNNNSVVSISSGSSVIFISPKALHLARLSGSGAITTGALFNISTSGSFSMNNSQISTWQGTSSQTAVPEGNRNAKFVNLTIKGSTTTLTDTAGNTTTSNVIDNTTRELTTVAINPGTIKVNYVNQNGEIIKTIDVPIDNDINYIGQYIDLVTKYYAETNMPENYMWAIGSQVKASAKDDAQSGGDNTTTADNGDDYGQANVAIVPMEGNQYTYNIYVYGQANDSIQYQYEDIATGQLINFDYINSGEEGSNTLLPPANYGNVIDWTDSYYTKTNVPNGYYYVTGSALNGKTQPTTTTVGTSPELKTIYVAVDKQTVNVTFVNSDGKPLNSQASPVSINGTTGQQLTYEELVTGYVTELGYQVANPDSTFTFDDTSNNGSPVDSNPQSLTVILQPMEITANVVTSAGQTVGSASGPYQTTVQLPVTDADLAKSGYIYTVTGPNGQTYNTLSEALAANNTYTLKDNSDPTMTYQVNYEEDPVSLSYSSSTSVSQSTVDSQSTSTSESNSKISESESISTSKSDSEISESESLSTSRSISELNSETSESESVSTSKSDSEISESESLSTSKSDSEISESESLSTSRS